MNAKDTCRRAARPALLAAGVFSLAAFGLTAPPVWGQLVGPALFEGREQAQAEAAERPAEAEARVAALGAELLARYGMAPPPAGKEAAPRAAALSALELARGRAEALVALIRDAPARALEAALPAEALDELRARNPELAPHLEQRGEWEGAASLIVADDFERGRSWEFHLLETPQGDALEAYGVSVGRRNGGRMRVSGIALRGRIAVQESHPAPAAEPPNPELDPGDCNTGEQKTAVYLVYRRGERPWTATQIREIREAVFGAENSLDYYVRAMSFGQAWLSGDVLTAEPVELDLPEEQLPSVADVEQATGLANLHDRFQRHIFITTFGVPIHVSALGSVPAACREDDSTVIWTGTTDARVLLHEFGHNTGLFHDLSIVNGKLTEYGGPTVMGSITLGGDSFNARQLRSIGWIDERNVVTVDEHDPGGSYELKSSSGDGNPPGSSPMALRIRRRPRLEDDEQWLRITVYDNAVTGDTRPVDIEVGDRQWLWVEGISTPAGGVLPYFGIEGSGLGSSSYGAFPIATYTVFPGPSARKRWVDPNSPLSLRVESISPDGRLTVRVNRLDPDTVPLISSNGCALATGTPAVGRIAPNALISVFGQAFAAAGTRAPSPALDAAGRVAGNLAGTCLEIGGRRVPLFYVSPTQINAQAPSGLQFGRTQARVVRNCGKGNELPGATAVVAVAPVSPAFFNLGGNADGRNPLVALHGGGPALVGPPELGAAFTPAEPGEVVTLFGTGFGTTEPALATGAIPGAAVPLAYDVSFSVGGIAVPSRDILYAGAAPCCAGLYQFTLRVPPDTSDGNAPVRATVRGIPSPAGPFLSVRRQQ